MHLALLQTYLYQDANNVWEALRVWLNAEPLPGLRFTAGSSNLIMLVAALVFVFMLELLLTIGIQIWERRTLARMHGRWGPRVHGNISPAGFRRVLIPIALLLAVPAVLYGLDYWTDVDLPPRLLPLLTIATTALAALIYTVYTVRYAWRQGLFDALKIFFKEDVVPQNADRFLFLFAPVMVYLPALLSWIVIPFGVMVIDGKMIYLVVQDLNVGLLLIIADFAMFLVAIIMSGYGSNNKYALIGAMREAAMLLTYEIPMLMSLLCVALFAGSLNLTRIVEAQHTTWGVLPLLPAFVIFLICALAETNRPPFDLAEASNELLGGYLVEYSGIRFSLFYIAEYANIFTASALMTVCFFGGWKGPMFLGFEGLWLTSLFWFLLKTYALVFFFIWARATMPRIRVDQIMFFSWKFLLPASVLVLIVTALGVAYRHPWFLANRIPETTTLPGSPLPVTIYISRTVGEAYTFLSLHEKAFFWGYNVITALLIAFLLWLGWRILRTRKKYPVPRREITWT